MFTKHLITTVVCECLGVREALVTILPSMAPVFDINKLVTSIVTRYVKSYINFLSWNDNTRSTIETTSKV